MEETANYEWSTTEKDAFLGEGTFGRVYKGKNKTNDQKVAVKKFQHSGWNAANPFITREAEIIKALDHKNVVKFFALEDITNRSLIKRRVLIMELCDETNLEDLIQENPYGLSSDQFARFSQNLIDAIKHLYEKNVVHRDLKPGNILVSHHNNELIFKIGDFGAARFLKENESYSSIYGTYEYLNPDLFVKFYARALNISDPPQSFNANHELWSIGISLFEAAVGKLSFAPKDGRIDKQKMHIMISQKQIGDICAAETEDGQIEWSNKLPEHCTLDDPLKLGTTRLLAGLLNVSIKSSM